MLHRYPTGVDGEKIYQKRLPKGAPDWVETAEVSFPSGRTADELCVTEIASVVWAVQMSTVEFHPWHTRRAAVEKPDELRIDLDPGPGSGVRRGQAGRRDRARTCSPTSAPRAGRRRPARRACTSTSASSRSSASARCAAQRSPSPARSSVACRTLVTTNWWKEERPDGAIFIDYNQNAKDRTIAAAYSVRGLPHAPVSAPVTWDELPDVEMADFTIATMPARFASLGDVHAGIDDAVWSIEPLLDWAARDEADRGLGDAPFPPNYPKQEGEPPRVQPSRMNRANWTEDGKPVVSDEDVQEL